MKLLIGVLIVLGFIVIFKLAERFGEWLGERDYKRWMTGRKSSNSDELSNDEKLALGLGFPLEKEELWLFGLTDYVNGKKRKLWVARKEDSYSRGDIMTLYKTTKHRYPYLKYEVISYYRKNGDWGMATDKFYKVKFVGFGRVRK